MLIGQGLQNRLLSILGGVANSLSIFMIGKELGQGNLQAISGALSARRLTFLEQSFLAGKAAQMIGTDALRTMTQAQLISWIRQNNLRLSELERSNLDQLRNDTEKWLQGQSDQLSARYRTAIANADRDWRATLALSDFPSAGAQTLARNGALQDLVQSLRDEDKTFTSSIDRLLQTEMHQYFQTGMIQGLSGEEMVYKIPRRTACRHCMRIYVKPNGAPKVYKLREVIGNSNWGKRAYSWKFTIGPTHPHCYCVLYRVKDRQPSKRDQPMAVARRTTLRKSLTSDGNHKTDNYVRFEDLKNEPDEAVPPHELALIKAVQAAYREDSAS